MTVATIHLEERFKQAYEFARDAHEGQTRKYDDDPYIVHPERVAQLVHDAGGDDNMVRAALNHDVVEDTVVTMDEFYQYFGPDVGELVEELTDVFTHAEFPYLNRTRRKECECLRMGRVSDRAKLIKVCDMADNSGDIVRNDPGFAVLYLKEKAALLNLINEGADRARKDKVV